MGRIGEYILGDRVGAGGVGVVYQARRAGSRQPLVVKFLQAEQRDARGIQRFRGEALAGRLVRHPNVASVIDDGCTEAGEHFLVMEHARGELLGRLTARSQLSVENAVAIAREILSGIAAMHAIGIVHGDIKSDNVIVESGEHPSIKLIDFGLARVQFLDDDTTTFAPAEERLSGTPDYMAPEIIRGQGACFASDQYAAGVILYEMLTGSTPFCGGTPSEIVQRHLVDEVVPPSLRRDAGDVPQELDRIVMRALAKDPHDRFPSVAAMSLALVDVHASPVTAPMRESRPGDRCGDSTPTLAGWSRRRRLAKGTPAHVGPELARRQR